MRNDNLAFADFNFSEDKEPRYTIEIEFDPNDQAQTWAITSHDDCAVPPYVGTNVVWDVIRAKGISASSQKLTPIKGWSSIGSINFSLVDADREVTNLISAQLAAGRGLRHKVVRVWMGGKGMVWDSYIQTETQIITDESFKGGLRDFSCSDVQRLTRQNVFENRETNLRASITDTDTVLPVYSTSDFEFNTHGTSYTDAPNETVIYVDVDKETVRATDKVDTAISLIGSDISFSAVDNSINSVATDLSVFSSGQQLIITGSALNDVAFTIAPTGPVANKILVLESVTTEAAGASINVLADVQFYNCTRGALNTRAVVHEINTSDAPDRRTKVTENIYIELPLVKMLLAMLTGNVEGQAQPFPSNWTLGIDTKWVASASFLGIGDDLWDTSNDVLGFTARFEKLSKRDGKKFIEEQLLRLGGCFMRVRNDGQLELRRFGRVAPDSAYVAVLNDNNVAKGGWGNLKQDFEQIHNVFTFHWNRDSTTGKLNRHQTLFDPDSILVHGAAPAMEFSFEGLTGYTHTQATLAGLRDSARDMHAGGPLLMTVKGMPHLNVLECGDIVRCQTSAVRDPITGGDLDRSYIILGTRKNWMTGEVVLVLFGSSQAAAPIADAANAILPDSFYQAGTDITIVTTGAYVGPVWHITADSTLVGHADANNLSAIYSFNGSVVLDPGVTLYIDDNVQLRIKEWTRNGTVDGVGRGIPGAVAVPPVSTSNRFTLATPGAIGVTESGGSVNYRHRSGGGFRADSWRGGVVEGPWASLPVFDIRWDGVNLVGLPNDLRGTPGSSGGGTFMEGVPGVAGGNGGNGPAALIIVAQNIYEGAAGSYNLSGGDGAEGSDQVVNGSRTMRAGAGAGGAPSGLLAVIDGPGFAFITLTADQGLSPTVGTVLDAGYVPHAPYGTTTSHYVGMPVGSRADANLRIQHLRDDSIAPEPDPPNETGRALSINVQVQQATKNGLNIIGLELSVNPPADTNYRASRLYIKLQGTDSWTLVGDAAGNEEKVVWVPADAATYNIKAHPIAINGNVSDAYIEDSYTVQATAGIVVIGSGNQVQTSDTVGEATNGQGLIIGRNAIFGYSPTGAEKTRIDASTGKITAVDVNLTGSITALAGSIGGWSVTAAKLSIGSGVAHLELNPTTGIWMGADLIADAPFSVTPAGALTSKSGSIGGWNIAAAKLSIGSGVAHLELNPASGIWMGADLIANAPFSVTPAGALTSKSGSIGGWTLSATNLSSSGLIITSGAAPSIRAGQTGFNGGTGFFLGYDAAKWKFSVGVSGGNRLTWDGTTLAVTGTIYATAGTIGGWGITAGKLSTGLGAAHLELNPITGIWMGANLIADAPFSVTPAGALAAKAGTIGGWLIGTSTIKSANNRVILDAGNQRIQLQNAAGTTYVRSDAEGILGVHATLGTVFKLPTDGSAPLFASGIINSTIFNITSSGILRTSSTVGDGGASGQGILANDTGLFGYKANSATPVFRLSSTDGKITALDALLTGGGITLSAGGALKSAGKVVGAGAGFFLGYDGGAYQFDVGDHDAKKSIHFDGSDLIIGENTKLLGASAYENDSLYIHELIRNPNNYTTKIENGAAIDAAQGRVEIRTSFLLDSEVSLVLAQSMTLINGAFSLPWTVNRRFKTKVWFTNDAMVAGRQWRIVSGAHTSMTYSNHIGFVVDGGVLKGSVHRASLHTLTAAIATLSTSTNYMLEATYNAADSTVNFYVDGVLEGTISGSTLMPVGAGIELFRIHGKTVVQGGTANGGMRVGEVKFLYNQ